MSDGQKSGQQRSGAREAEELLRRTAFAAVDPFIALSESYRRTAREDKLSPAFLDDEDDR